MPLPSITIYFCILPILADNVLFCYLINLHLLFQIFAVITATMSWQDWIPVPNLMRQAWDATKLAVATRAIKKERALVLAQKNPVAKTYKRREAIKEIKRLFEAGDYEGVARSVLPEVVVDKTFDLVEFWWKVWDIYWIFVLLRIVFTFIPSNSGYLHPDEYFQSVEVVVGDALELETHRTWEFNVTAPLRSLSLPFALYGAPLTAMKHANLYILLCM